MKIKVKQLIKKTLRRRKVRLILATLLMPVSFVIISLYRLFDYDWYKSQFAEDRRWVANRYIALVHYLLHGKRRGLTPNPFFIPEYFDNRNWQDSILDPLMRYIIDKNNWRLPTSILFNPRNSDIEKNRFMPPLAVFMRNLNDKTLILADGHTKELIWSDIKPSLLKSNNVYRQQEMLRNQSRPVYKFDYKHEKQIINACSSFDFSEYMNDKSPFVSIIMPVWNREELVVEAIKSAQAQTFESWELIITDDGSTDDTVRVIEGIIQNDSRIKLLQPGHGGVCKARNSSIAEAQGEWIAFLDSDNTWQPDYLQTMLASLIDNSYKSAYSAIKMESHGKTRYRTTEPSPDLLSIGNYIDLNALVVHKTILDKVGYFDESLRRMVDYDLVCRISKQTDFMYVPIIGVLYTDHDDAARITTTELTSWDGVIKNKNWVDWSEASKDRNDSLISVIVPVRGDIRTAARALKSLGREVDGRKDVEIVIADSSSSSATNLTLDMLSLLSNIQMRHLRFPASHDSTLGANYGFVHSRGNTVVFIEQRMVVEPGFLNPLIEAVDASSGIFGPVQLKHSRLIHSAGEIFPSDEARPIHLLENHPLSDQRGLDDKYTVPALNSGVVAMRAETFASLKGFYPLYDRGFETHDLSMRAAVLGMPSIIVKQSRVTSFDEKRGLNSSSQQTFFDSWSGKIVYVHDNLWEKAGFELLEYKNSVPKLRVKGKRGMRWAIKISAPADERRFAWGDLYYAEALATALEQLGQTVAIDFHNHHDRPTAYLDDVILDLRGLDDVAPQAGKMNIMWVISHPEKVTPEIVRSFDKVYAAGGKWATYMAEKSGVDIEFLPQCTDPEVFHPTKPDPNFKDKVLFIGNSRGVLRPIVDDAIKAELDVAVYGGGWEGLIDHEYIKGTFIPNDKLAEAYGSARVVLNDHWGDMRRWGFLSNRLFDVAATATPIITDDIPGLSEVFADLVQSYKSSDELKDILKDYDKIFANKQKRLKVAKYIRENHSFMARAKELLEAANNMHKF